MRATVANLLLVTHRFIFEGLLLPPVRPILVARKAAADASR
jgi:hypothetical protein